VIFSKQLKNLVESEKNNKMLEGGKTSLKKKKKPKNLVSTS
jgi:hypothetical protein